MRVFDRGTKKGGNYERGKMMWMMEIKKKFGSF